MNASKRRRVSNSKVCTHCGGRGHDASAHALRPATAKGETRAKNL